MRRARGRHDRARAPMVVLPPHSRHLIEQPMLGV